MAAIRSRGLAGQFVFQDDNAPAHRARTINTFLQNQGVQRLPWPAYSPDINPIENIWGEMTRRINAMDHLPSNIAELRQALLDVWDAIPLETLRACSESMPRRLQALRRGWGGPTRY